MNSYRVKHTSSCGEAEHVESTHRSHDCAMEKFRKCERDFKKANPASAGVSYLCGYVVEKFNGTDWVRVW